MSQKLIEIAKATSKGTCVGYTSEINIDVCFLSGRTGLSYIGFRFVWKLNYGLWCKGYFNTVTPTREIGFWIREIRKI